MSKPIHRPGLPHSRDSEPAPGRDLLADRDEALALVPVSRETEERLAVYVALLIRWQTVKNLVGPSTLGQIWTRHIADSAQLLEIAPSARTWTDMGSGAGFPGMVVAIQLHQTADAAVHLIESNARKCAFLREVARQCGAPAIIHNARVEDVLPELAGTEVVTARALAPLPALLRMAKEAIDRGAVGLFLKSDAEVASADLEFQDVRCSILPSRSNRDGRVVMAVRAPHRVAHRSKTEGSPS